MKNTFIMVGLPGSGKSTWIKNNLDGDAVVCSADHYHVRKGVYEYQTELATFAHDFCLLKFKDILALNPRWVSDLVVDNTNLVLGYLSPYYYLARAHGFHIRVVWVNTPIEVARQRDTHGVPQEVFDRMVVQEKKLLEDWPKQWAPIEEASDAVDYRRLPSAVNWKDADTH